MSTDRLQVQRYWGSSAKGILFNIRVKNLYVKYEGKTYACRASRYIPSLKMYLWPLPYEVREEMRKDEDWDIIYKELSSIHGYTVSKHDTITGVV